MSDSLAALEKHLPAPGTTLNADQLLERFLFDKEQQYQYASTLSGGERRRLHLCTVLMKTTQSVPQVVIAASGTLARHTP